jgi:hypothetical protein
MSPLILSLSDIQPSQSLSAGTGDGGTTSAVGLPRRVTRNGTLVLLTST